MEPDGPTVPSAGLTELKGLVRGKIREQCNTCVEGSGFKELTGDFLILLSTMKIKERTVGQKGNKRKAKSS